MEEVTGVEGEELDVDRAEVRSALRAFRQGDILDVAKLAWLYSPDSPNHPSEVEDVPAEEPVMTQEKLIPSRLSVIVTQTCDLWQTPDIDQWVLLAPLVTLDASDHDDANHGRSVRFFSYPEIPGHEELERVAIDARIITPLEKMALMSSHIEHTPSPLSEPRRAEFANFLGNRLGRFAFSDEIVEELLRPIELGLKRVTGKSGYKPFFDSVIYFGLAWTPGMAYASLLVLTSQHRRELNSIDENAVRSMKKRLQDAVTHRLRESPYEATVSVHDAETVPATEILSHHQIQPDLHGALLED